MKGFLFALCCVFVSFWGTSQLTDAKKTEFNKLVRDADLLFSQNKFLDAKKAYESALVVNPLDSYASKQLEKCVANEKLKGKEEENKSYQKIINKGDEKFGNADYQGAKNLYERALEFKPNDPYPKQKLKEIEDLLNPKTAAKTAPLPDLGQASEMSIADAQKALKAAELERKNKQNTNLESKGKKLTDEETELAANRLKEMQASTVSIKEVEKKIEFNVLNNKAQQDTLNNYLQEKERNTEDIDDKYHAIQNQKNLTSATDLDKTKLHRDSSLTESKEIGFVNDKLLFDKNKKSTDSLALYSQKVYDEQSKSRIELYNFADKQERTVVDNKESQQILAELVTNTNVQIQKKDDELTENKTKNTNTLLENVTVITEDIDKKVDKDSKTSGENMKGLVISKDNFNGTNDSLYASPEQKILENKGQFFKVDGKSIDSLTNHSIALKNDQTVQLQAMESVIKTEEYNIENERLENRNKLQEDLKKKKQDHTNLDEIGQQKQDNTAEELKKAEQKSFELGTTSQLKEIDEKFNSKDKINTLETKVVMGNSENNGIASENAASISNVNNSLNGSTSMDSERQTIKNLESRAFLENIEKKSVKFDENVANSIGSMYPEGVTQESFNKNDEDGLLVSVVTRRIVVKNGYGQIYTRTQTADTITYSKNGTPSTEYIWQRETQDAKLKKN